MFVNNMPIGVFSGIVLFLFSHVVFAADFSKFNIKGLSLGKSYDDIKSKLPCRSLDIYKLKSGKYKGSRTFCEAGDNFISIHYDHKHEIFFVERNVYYRDILPDFSILKKQIFEKYGKPDAYGKASNSYEISIDMCWGICKVYSQKNNEFWNGTSAVARGHGRSLWIEYNAQKNGSYGNMKFELKDYDAERKTVQWQETMDNRYSKDKRREISNIDL